MHWFCYIVAYGIFPTGDIVKWYNNYEGFTCLLSSIFCLVLR